MKRCVVLGALLAVGVLTLSVAGTQQAPPGPAPASLAATKIEKLKDNLYIITGSSDFNAFSGGNTAVFITNTGVVLVDTKLPGWGPTLLERIKTVTNKPVTTIINTHAHDDHYGSNEFFGTTVDSVVHENAKALMAKAPQFANDKAKFLPRRTYKDKLVIGAGNNAVELYYFGRGHTSGDTFVVFPSLRTMHAGDMFAWKAIPYIDTMSGGSVVEQPQTLTKVIAAIKNVDTVIPGHIPPTTWNEFREFADFTQDFVNFAQRSKGGQNGGSGRERIHSAGEIQRLQGNCRSDVRDC
jgi:cyclase